MKPLRYLFIATLLTSVFSCKVQRQEETSSDLKVPFGDPFIMLWEDTYYAYGTKSRDGIAVYVSDDLLSWEKPENISNGLALRKDDVWAERSFWAPEVYHIDGTFYMYYSADEHICVATSDSPLGPFIQEVKAPMLEDERAIDNSLFIDDDGNAYLLFCRFNDGLNVWIAELEDDLQTIRRETMKKCINVSQDWEEVWPRVNEGAFIVKHMGKYYMTYSANSYESQFYGVGFATADNIYGPWEKYDANPVLQKPGSLVGVGHSAIFNDKNGQMRIVFHAHSSDITIHPRHMYISNLNFKDIEGTEVLFVDDEYITPKIVE
jgi:beta-xylosidase